MAQQRTFATDDSVIVRRASQELRDDYKKNFAHGGTVFFEHFPSFSVRYPTINASLYPARFVEFVAGNLTDRYAKDTLEKDFKCLNWLRECAYLVPLYTTGDGNCLLHAASLAMWGFEDKEFILRNALYDSLTTADRNVNTLQDRCRMSISSMLRDVHVNVSDNDWIAEWQLIVNQARPNSSGFHQSLEESHIFVLANILRRPIIVYGVPKARSFNTGGTMQNINFHGIYLPLLWGSQLCHKPPLCLGYGMGHFTALVPTGNPQQQLTVPLTDNTGHVLPIRFLLQAEEQNTFYLLEQYLDVTKLYSSSSGRQISAAVVAIREAAHVRHLVNEYIDMSLVEFNKQNQPYYAQPQPPATSQRDTQCQQCVGCDSGVYASAETNFLCSVCFKKHTAAAADYNTSTGLKCRLPGCQQQGLTSKDGYCNECYSRNRIPAGEQCQWNNFDAGKAGNPSPHNPTPRPAGGEPGQRQKCYKCNDFFANEEYNGLCSGCFKKLTIEESQQKPQFSQPPHMQVQPNPIQANNNVEPVADKCKVCEEFHGDPQYGGLCSVCFKNKSKAESVAKPPQQPWNDFQHIPKQDQFHQPLQTPPAHQQRPAYDQSRVNPAPVGGSSQQPNVFGFNQCLSRGCARLAHEQCRGYCVQCFDRSVERYQKSQENQQKLVQQQDQQWQQGQQRQQQQNEQSRRHDWQEAERQHLERQNKEQEKMRQESERQCIEQEKMRQEAEQEKMRQEAERQRLKQASKEQERMKQETERHYFEQETIGQQEINRLEEQRQREVIKTPQGNDFVSQQQQQRPQHAPVTGDLCANMQCGDFAAANCNGFCSSCYSSQNPPADTAASPSNTPAANSRQRPPIKPRRNLPPKTEVILEKPLNETVETMSVGGRSQFTSASSGTNNIKCFMCAKVNPTTGDLSYSLCPAHAQQVMKSVSFDSLPPSQQPEASYTTQESSSNHDMHSNQQRRTSSDYLQPVEPGQYPTEQNMKHYSGDQHSTRSGEQHQLGRVANHYSGEQVNRSPCLSGPQANPSNQLPQLHQTHHHTGEQLASSHGIPSNQQRRTSSDCLQPVEPGQYPTEQNFKHYSGEQHLTRSGEQHQLGRVANHYSGEQVNRSPLLSGSQANPSNQPPQFHQTHHHTGEQLASSHGIPSSQLRRTSHNPTEQNMKHYSGEQHSTRSGEQHQLGRVANHYSGEQVNRSPHLSGPQANPSNQPPQFHQAHHHTGEQLASSQQYHQPHVPRSQATELPFGGGLQSNFPPNSKRYVQGSDQPSYLVNNPDQPPLGCQNAHQDDYSQGEYNSHRNYKLNQSRSQDDVNERSRGYINQDQTRNRDQCSYQPGQNSNHHENHRNWKGDASSEIKYPPKYFDPTMRHDSQDHSSRDQLQYSSYHFNNQLHNQFNEAGGGYSSAGGGYPSASNSYYPQSHQQQPYQQGQNYNQHQYEQTGGGNQPYGRNDDCGGTDQYPQQPRRGNQGHGGAGNYGAANGGGAAGNYPPQGGSYREGAGSQSYVPPQKPSISSHADPNATHSHTEDRPRKVLCKIPGCSFYAIPECENYCQDCYDTKSGLKNYRRCKTPNCPNHVPASNAASYCDTCLVSTAR